MDAITRGRPGTSLLGIKEIVFSRQGGWRGQGDEGGKRRRKTRESAVETSIRLDSRQCLPWWPNIIHIFKKYIIWLMSFSWNRYTSLNVGCYLETTSFCFPPCLTCAGVRNCVPLRSFQSRTPYGTLMPSGCQTLGRILWRLLGFFLTYKRWYVLRVQMICIHNRMREINIWILLPNSVVGYCDSK